MIINIEDYKGQTIEYDDNIEKFVCAITSEDNSKNVKRLGLKDVRKDIDLFLKANLNFKPFKVLRKTYRSEIEVIDVNAIRTDGKFVCKIHRSYVGEQKHSEFISIDKVSGNYFEYDFEIVKALKEIADKRDAYNKLLENEAKVIVTKLKPLNQENLPKL